MTARELMEKVIGITLRCFPQDCPVVASEIESLLSAALAEAETKTWKEAKADAWIQWQKDVKEARAEAFEEAARICYCFQVEAVKQLGGKCMCPGCVFAEAIRRRAGEWK